MSLSVAAEKSFLSMDKGLVSKADKSVSNKYAKEEEK